MPINMLKGKQGPPTAEELVGEMRLKGVGVSPGIAIGPVYVYSRTIFEAAPRKVPPEEVENEVRRFEEAVQRAERELAKIAAVAREKIGEASASIFEAQALMLRDEALYNEVVELIRREHWTADYAVQRVMDEHRQRWEASGSQYLIERVNDLIDVEQRLIRILQRGRIISKIDPETIVVAENLTAADVVLFSRRRILGFVTEYGGPTSHVAITARALGVPAIVSAHGVTEWARNGDTIILDAITGKVVIRPRPETLTYYRRRQEWYREILEKQKELRELPAETLDKHRVRLEANLEFQEELPLLKEYGAEGIGLFRTELQFLAEGRFIPEESQFELYRTVLEGVKPFAATFRLLDIGGDKVLPLAHREHNPFLGWRGIRILLDRAEELLYPQLRAILRASAYGEARILIPMVSVLEELVAFYDIFEEVKRDLAKEDVPFDEEIPVGIMVEVPSAALLAHVFAEYVDFFSIGTNDLTQYTLAVDRGNDMVAHLYEELHPAVLRLIKQSVDAAHAHGISVSLCGEMASRPRATPILVGLGIDALSMSPAFLLEIKQVLRALTLTEAREIATKALEQPDAPAVLQLVNHWMAEHLPELARFLEIGPDTEPKESTVDQGES